MIGEVLILRPQPGAGETAARAVALGLEAIVAPLFEISPLGWDAPDAAEYDAVLLTSANAARHGGGGLAALTALPCHAVGEASAAAARAARFSDVTAGSSDGAAALANLARSGARRVLHLCGREHIALSYPGVTVERRLVYAADSVSELPAAAREALARGAVALLHSPRAAAAFASLAGERGHIRLAAISAAAADAAGNGWVCKAVAAAPRDEALLEVAGELCNTAFVEAAARR
jgi:uroporphyrinogen-III synthase